MQPGQSLFAFAVGTAPLACESRRHTAAVRMRRFAVGFLLLSFAACSTRHEDERAKATDELFAEWKTLKSPGCAVGVLQNDAFLLRRAYGSKDLNRQIPIGPDTVFSVASMSKQFTAAAIGLLIVRGKVSLDDDVHKSLLSGT